MESYNAVLFLILVVFRFFEKYYLWNCFNEEKNQTKIEALDSNLKQLNARQKEKFDYDQ